MVGISKQILIWKARDINNDGILESGNEIPTGGVMHTAGKKPEYAVFYVFVDDAEKEIKIALENGGALVRGPVTDDSNITFARS